MLGVSISAKRRFFLYLVTISFKNSFQLLIFNSGVGRGGGLLLPSLSHTYVASLEALNRLDRCWFILALGATPSMAM